MPSAKADAERYEREIYPKAPNILKPFLTTPVNLELPRTRDRSLRAFVEALPEQTTSRRNPEANALGFYNNSWHAHSSAGRIARAGSGLIPWA